PRNTVPNPHKDLKAITTQSGITLAGPSDPSPPSSSSKEVERVPESTTDQVLTESTTRIPPLIVQLSPASTSSELRPAHVSSPMILEQNPHQPPIPYPSRLNKEKLQGKADIQIHSFLQMFKKIYFNISFAEALAHMPNQYSRGCFRSSGKVTFPADFVVVDYDVDPRVPLILGRRFSRMAHALVDVHGEELTLRVGDEKLVFNVESTSKYPRKHGDESIHKIDILDIICEDHFHEVLNVQKSINPMSVRPTPSSNPVFTSLSPSLSPFGDSDFILKEIDMFLASNDSTSPNVDEETFDIEGDICLIETL
ncbi:hypothetical protein Tco_1127382, partial [Tanacetum coccineum]